MAFGDSSALYFAVSSPFHAQLYRLVPNGTTGVGNPGRSAALHLHAAPNPVTETVAIEWSSAREGPAESDLAVWRKSLGQWVLESELYVTLS